MAEMITKGKEQVRGKSVLLYSGGMDSLMIDYLMKPDILLNVNMRSSYDARERESFAHDKLNVDMSRMIYLHDELNLEDYPEYIISNINLFKNYIS